MIPEFPKSMKLPAIIEPPKPEELPVDVGQLFLDRHQALLPATYQAMVAAIDACDKLDEVADWTNKAEALKAYAREAHDDETLLKAIRIRNRATRRCGELLKEFDAQGKRTDQLGTDSDTKLSKREAAEAAGLSKRQQNTATQIANIPKAEFKRLNESANPPSTTDLAKRGTKKQVPIVDLDTIQSEESAEAKKLIGALDGFVRTMREINFDLALRGLEDHERQRVAQDRIHIHDVITELRRRLADHGAEVT